MKHFRLAFVLATSVLLLAACGGMQSAGIDGDVGAAVDMSNAPTRTFEDWQSGSAAASCALVGDFDFAYKLEPVSSGSFTHEGATITVTTEPGNLFDWSATSPISAVIVKGGPGANLWEYDPAALADEGLYAPVNDSGLPAGLSHIVFCWNEDERKVFETLDVVKTAVAEKDKQFSWKLKKSVAPYAVYGVFGSDAEPDAVWTIEATKLGWSYVNFRVSGEITITNPNPFEVEVAIADVLGDGTVASITCGGVADADSYMVPAKSGTESGQLVCDYVAYPDGMASSKNTVTVTLIDIDETEFDGFLGPYAYEKSFGWTFSGLWFDSTVQLQDPMLGIDESISATTKKEITRTYACDLDETYEYWESIDRYVRKVVNVATLTSKDGTGLDLTDDATLYVKCTCEPEWKGETAWGAGDRYEDPGNWATFTSYTGVAKIVTLFAGQTLDAGTVAFSVPGDGNVTITITLNPGWRFADVAENVKIQDYASPPPTGNPAIGLFAHKGDETSSSFSIDVPVNDFYGVHADVEWAYGSTCPVIDTEPKD